MKKNIALIGFMGSGKSTVAAILSKKLGLELIEIDEEIVRVSGLSNVNEIFVQKGETYFRELEKKAITNALKKTNQVISCGGGVVSSDEVMNLLKKNCRVVFLQADFKTITKRLKDSDSRPLFKEVEKAESLYKQRSPLYEKYSDIRIETDTKTPEKVAEAIIKKLVKHCMVIGDPVSHSLSPAMHNAAFKALGVDSEYSFEAKQIKSSELGKFMDEIRENIHMLAVTIPHKETIVHYVDKLDNTAKEIGAVNTVINDDGVLTGYNTDCPGAINILKQHTNLAGKAVVVLGSGGTAKAIVHGLSKEGLRVIICSRNKEESEKLAAKYNAVSLPWEAIGNVAEADIIINTTPIGRNGEEFPHIIQNLKDRQKLDNKGKPTQIIFDVNYNPDGIPLLKQAEELGLTAIDGLELLLQQGILQFELYTGLSAPVDVMRKTLLKTKHYENAG
jgi:shikimate dehydrogenase